LLSIRQFNIVVAKHRIVWLTDSTAVSGSLCITLAEADHSLTVTIQAAYKRVACLTSTTADV